jgi:small subunit ribosomal protein S16
MRLGAKKRPFYRVVVKEKRSKRDGAYLENLGTYDPLADPADVRLNHDRIQYWIGVGAQPSDTVKSLIKNNPVMSDEEREAMMKARADKKAAAEAERAAAKKAEADRLAAEAAEKEAAEKAAAEAEAAAAAAEAPAEVETAETPAGEDPLAAPAAEGQEFPDATAVAEAEAPAAEVTEAAGPAAEAPAEAAPEADSAEA